MFELSSVASWLSTWWGQLGQELRPLGLPLGGILIGVVLGCVAYLSVDLLRRRPRTTRMGTVPIRVVPADQERPELSELLAGAASSVEKEVRVYGKGGDRVVRMIGAGEHPSTPLPRARRFVLVLVAAFLAIAVPLLLLFPRIFGTYDHLVALVGTDLYWPLRWPGVYTVTTSALVVPDYIFPLYLAGIAAFAIASGLWSPSPGQNARRRTLSVLVVLLYIGAELVLDSVFFTVPGSAFRDLALLARTLTGGLFLALMTFCAVHLPHPQEITPRFSRERHVLAVFFGFGVAALAVSGVGLVAVAILFPSLPILRNFTVLLVLPALSLEVFSLLAGVLYRRRARLGALPGVAEYHPSVSILIPAYNEEQWIAGSIRAADRASREYPGLVEIIIGNDGSTDRTLEIARRAVSELQYAQGFVVDLPHGGKSNALNGALAVATGEIVIRCDGDTMISPEHGFSQMIRHFSDPRVGGVQGAIHPRQLTGWTRKLRALEVAWNHYLVRPAGMATRSAEVIDGLFSAFRRQDLVEMGGWVPWNGEDTELSIRVQRLGYEIRIEFGAVALEDVPENYDALRKQRVRWARGIIMANGQHYPALLGPTPEFAGLGVFLWLLMYVHSGVRSLVYVYLLALVLILGVPSLLDTFILLLIVTALRAAPLAYYLGAMGRKDVIAWIPFFPIANIIKQTFRFEAYGTLGPSALAEYV